MSLHGKAALITGGGRGIGRGIALALAAQGCAVAIQYARKPREAEETAAAAAVFNVPTTVVRANLARSGDATHMVNEAAARLGRLDILIANAASGVLKPVVALEDKDWDWTLDVNARSVLAAAQAAVPYMRQHRWGRIITVSSLGSRRVMPQYGIVGVSKAALETLTRYLAVELASAGIIANCIAPGLVLTDALDHFPMREEMIRQAQANTPAGRLVTPEDVGRVVAWLCSDAAAMLVGQTLDLDGGYSLKMMA